jgi:hypothetical protein
MIFKIKWTWNIIYKRIAALLFVEPNAFWFICRFYMIHLQFIHNVMLFYDSRIIYSSSYKLYFFLHDSSTVHTCIIETRHMNSYSTMVLSDVELKTWYSHTGSHVKDNGTGPHSLSSTTFFALPWPSQELKARGEVQPCKAMPGGWREQAQVALSRALHTAVDLPNEACPSSIPQPRGCACQAKEPAHTGLEL